MSARGQMSRVQGTWYRVTRTRGRGQGAESSVKVSRGKSTGSSVKGLQYRAQGREWRGQGTGVRCTGYRVRRQVSVHVPGDDPPGNTFEAVHTEGMEAIHTEGMEG